MLLFQIFFAIIVFEAIFVGLWSLKSHFCHVYVLVHPSPCEDVCQGVCGWVGWVDEFEIPKNIPEFSPYGIINREESAEIQIIRIVEIIFIILLLFRHMLFDEIFLSLNLYFL